MSAVLVVDDHERMRDLLGRLVDLEGHRPLLAGDGQAALGVLAQEPVDLVLLDLVMPRQDGFDVLRTLRQRRSPVPVIVLSAVPDVESRVRALDGGAVDFVRKPFSAAELAARVRRSLPARPDRDPPRIEAAGVALDPARRVATWDGQAVQLSDRESSLLAHLMDRCGLVCDRKSVLQEVWGLDFDPGTNVIDVCVRRLRKRLPGLPILTVRSVGYCLEAGQP